MAGLSAVNAALEGVRLIRAKPRVVLLWALYYFAFLIVLEGIAYFTLGGHMTELLAAMRNSPTEPTALERLIHTVMPFILIGGAAFAVFQAMFTAAVYRKVLSPDEVHSGLRLGMDELRLLAVFALLLSLPAAMVFVDTYLFLVTASLPDNMLTVAFVALAVIATWVAVAVGLVRLSLAGAASVALGRLAIGDGWRLAGGNFARLLGAYLLATALSFLTLGVMNLVVRVVFGVIAGVVGRGAASHGSGPTILVASLVLEVVVALIVACSYVILLAPPAAAYAALTGETVEPEGAVGGD